MSLPDRFYRWRDVARTHTHLLDDGTADAIGTRRMRRLLCVMLLLIGVVGARIVAIELTDGAQLRTEAARPLTSQFRQPAMRGRILAADGTVLARDEPSLALAMHFRWLEQPANERWLRSQVRSRLPRADWRNPECVQAETAQFLAMRDAMHRDLARLCGMPASQLAQRMQGVNERVSKMAQRVNERRQAQAVEEQVEALPEDASWWQRTAAWFTRAMSSRGETRALPPITVAEELDYHVLCTGLSLEAVAEIEGHPDRYLGVRVVQQVRRKYESGALAANVLGHLGVVNADEIARDDAALYTPTDHTGRMGVERQYESILHGRPGTSIEQTDRTGRLLARDELSPAEPGVDVVLSIDPQLQRLAEALIDDALRRAQRHGNGDDASASGGAAVILDVRNGAVYCAASGPRFDPNAMSSGDGEALAATLAHPGRPLFDRVTKMAIPPGSVFKAVTAAALLEETDIDPQRSLDCRGYLRDPDRLRCMLYRHQGIGHGPTNLVQALARSCNVYFFHHAGLMGPEPMVDWARRFGLGARTGIDTPDEAAGHVPDPTQPPSSSQAKWTLADTQALSIGQSTLATTPLQMARMMAAVANGGRLVTPRVVERVGASGIEPTSQGDDFVVDAPATELNLSTRTLDFLCDGLEAVVADEDGTGHRMIHIPTLAIAGKTGTAETGGGRADHAWFVGYAPADRPRIAIAVAIEHAGSGAEVAGPIAKRLVLKLEQLGYFGRRPLAENASR